MFSLSLPLSLSHRHASMHKDMTNSQRAASNKCFSGMLRQLLCKRSLPTQPSDHITEVNTAELIPEKDSETEAKLNDKAPANPGIVARLMGLDSMPDISRDPNGSTARDSLGRSRSVNSLEYLLRFDRMHDSHRRVRTSVSFREMPTFLNQQNQDFFVVRLETVDERKELGSKQRKSGMGYGELRQKKAERNKSRVNRGDGVLMKDNQENNMKLYKLKDELMIRRVSAKSHSKVAECNGIGTKGLSLPLAHSKDVYRKPCTISRAKRPLKPVIQKESSVKSKFAKKKKSEHSANKVVPECSSESVSSVSVLDVHDFSTHPETSLSDDSRPMGLNARKKSAPKVAKSDHSSPNLLRISSTDDHEPTAIFKNKANEKMKTNYNTHDLETHYYVRLLNKICTLTEEDMKKSNWLAKGMVRFEDFEEMCMEFGHQILELLLQQVVDELLEFPMKD